jgi:hypothetical protein
MAFTMSSVDYTPDQLATLSTHDIETVLDRDHVYLPRNSKQKRFQNWAKTFSCEPERGESILTVLVSAVAGGSSYVDRYSV